MDDLLLTSYFRRSLVRHPTVIDRLRQEIRSTLGDNENFKREDLMRMKYLKNVLKESMPLLQIVRSKHELTTNHPALRLYPSVPVNTRVALKTTTLPTGGGPDRTAPVLVRRGEAIAYCVYTLHRQVHLYGEDAEEFRPERWDDEDLPLKRNRTDEQWGYLPFNGGPRVCLGRKYLTLCSHFAMVGAS